MSKTKRVYINTISIVILISLLFIDNLSSEKALSSFSLPVPNSSKSMTTTTDGLTNTTNATSPISENVTGKLENTTSALENATAALTNATEALQNISSISAAARLLPTTTANATAVNATTVISSIFDNNLPALFIIVIFLIIVIPLVFDMFLAYRKKPKDSTDKENNRVVGMPGLYRSLMTFGIIVLVGTVIFYLLALITLNINNSTSPVLQSLIDILKSLGTILGTALATIIAFYFGMRGAESATEKAAAATKQASGEKVPPKVLNTIPADGATEVPVTSLVSATFSKPMSSPTINANTFTVKKEDEATPITGILSLSSDGKTAIFDSTQDFSPNTKYVAAIDIGAEDLAGNALVSAKRWSFTTKT
jgi:succinate dehydrogenase/fumarate reductase cytochrome b subunit